jgi:hypothetical protein
MKPGPRYRHRPLPSLYLKEKPIMPDARPNPVALVYQEHQDPDAILRDFATALNKRGFRVVGMVQAGQCADSSLSAILLHNGEQLLLAQDFDPSARGCRLDVNRLEAAGKRVSDALEAGADLLIVNRFGKREREGRGLLFLIERALNADIPVVIAVSSERLADWTTFAGPANANLACERQALDAWWHDVARETSRPAVA